MPSPPVLSLQDVAAGAPLDLDLDADGVPRRPLVVVDLDSDPVPAAGRLEDALPVVVGITRDPQSNEPAADACDLTLATGDGQRSPRFVPVADVDAALAVLVAKVASAPRAAVALAALLRQTSSLPPRDGLLAESAAYSTLLAGPDFAAWLRSRGARRPVPSGDPLRVERDGDVLRLTLARPERRNAVTAALRDALVDALAIAHADPSLRVEITAEGPDFSTGGDLDEFGTAPDVATAHLVRSDRSVGAALLDISDRVRVRMHGRAQGSGLEMPAFAGHITATPDATFELPELALGLVPGAGGTVSVTRRIFRWRTAWLALSGAVIDAPTALRWGLIDAVA
ncbi:MAG TPA: enoyl-CoA hydratase/isomerase family protein [Mycobacteriales bacterium]|nr:enoyl-CoA hydratase/isomerase family protein [Mycobacteriales bacterium]